MTEKWCMVDIKTDDYSMDAVANFLIELGSSGNEEIKNGIRGYFRRTIWNNDREKKLKVYLNSLNELGYATKVNGIRINEHNDKDWVGEWKKHYKEVRIAHKLVVLPSWMSEGEKTEIIIDPGMAFGTGTHETTKLILHFISDYIKEGDHVCDLGTGSGILAIAAVKLGADNVVALDTDEEALLNAKKNSTLNKMDKKIKLIKGDIRLVKDLNFDLVTANIDFNVILDNRKDIIRCVKKNGYILISGILGTEKDVFHFRFKDKCVDLEREDTRGEWAGLVYRRVR